MSEGEEEEGESGVDLDNTILGGNFCSTFLKGWEGRGPVRPPLNPPLSARKLNLSLAIFSAQVYNLTDTMRFLFIVVVALFGASEAWDNVLTKDLYFTCPTHQAIWKVESQHANHDPDDRYFDFHCRDFPSFFDFCSWTNFINLYGTPGLFSCGDNKVIVGAHSIFSQKNYDRQ
ncbi:hemagglutinin/amebocyte aggregation factor-like [Anneissia japonica]|uniref:hemagglutinin/amebocyte aggregation factor-like n=1 Tax=Anneissia japonica TaxID=1529436 RepID=UPI001425B6A1|nr:hemagglutinin/amebocyte aggregation factor-like [Anneissia japonica]